MIRIYRSNPAARSYTPPFPVRRHFEDVDTSLPANDQINDLMWIAAVLTSRILGQYPHLREEGDELFSIGVAKIVEIVNRAQYDGEKIGAVCNVQCARAMEDYANGLGSVVRVCTQTRYDNRRKGRRTPACQQLGTTDVVREDHTDIIVRDAAQHLGLDLTTLTLRQKRKLAKVLS